MVRTRGALVVVAALGALAIAAGVVALARGVPNGNAAPAQPQACWPHHDRSRPCQRAARRPAGAGRQAFKPSPAVIKQSLVTSRADGNSTDGGNAWGPEKLRIVRATDGILFSVYPSGPDTVDKTYNLMESINGGSSWSRINDRLIINGTPDDGGRETPLLLISPSNVVYLISWAGGRPTLITEGVNGSGPYAAAPIPGAWQSGDNDPYAGAAIDSDGDLYVQENTASSTSGATEDSGYVGNLAWTTGGTAHLSWHFTRLPHLAADNYRYTYSFELPGAKGVFDAIATRDVSCDNTALDSQYGYSSAPAGGYVLDTVQDWHTNNINARGGPKWEITSVAHDYTNTCGRGLVSDNEFAEDAYRDTHADVDVIYFDAVGRVSAYHAVLGASRQSWRLAKTVALPRNYCANEARITQDSTGRFYVISQCNRASLYVWPASRTDGTRLGRLFRLALSRPIDGWDYFAVRGRSSSSQNYLDMVYPTDSASGLAYARIRLARR